MKTTAILPCLLLALLLPATAQVLPSAPDEAALKRLLADRLSRVLLLDVRTQEEFAEGRIPGAVLMPYDEIAARFAEPDRARPIVVYCRSGRRSAVAAQTLRSMGYTNVADFGGISNWRGALERK